MSMFVVHNFFPFSYYGSLRYVSPKFLCFLSGYTIPKGWKVLVWFRSVHFDPEIYIEPKKFDPSRWDVSFRYISFLTFSIY